MRRAAFTGPSSEACDATVMQECSGVISWDRGGILPEIMLFVMCAIQQNLFQFDRHHEVVWARQRRGVERSEKAGWSYRLVIQYSRHGIHHSRHVIRPSRHIFSALAKSSSTRATPANAFQRIICGECCMGSCSAATALHVKRMIEWRDSAVHQRRKEYRDTMLSIQDSAAQVKSWTDELRKAERSSGGGVMDQDGNRVFVSEVALKPFAAVTSATTVRLTWEMEPNAPNIDYFTVKREPYPRVTALPHYTHGVRAEVAHTHGTSFRNKDHMQSGALRVKNLTPGYAYTFVVHSFTELNGHSTESDSSNPIELPLESLEAERSRQGLTLVHVSAQRKLLWSVIRWVSSL